MIRVKNLYKRYDKHEILKGLDLEVHSGETVVILGQSGTGKSVLLKQIMGLEKPDAGEIFIDSINLTSLQEPQLYHALRGMGMLFQGSALFDSMTIGENVAFYLQEHRLYPAQKIATKVAEALEMVGLEGQQKMMPSTLSGGMRKRAALARLIVYRPKILLYDEPTTGLDPITAMQINQLLVQIQKELHATSLVVTHDLCSTFHIADRIALHHEGKIAHITSKEAFTQIKDPLVETILKNSIPAIPGSPHNDR